MAKKDNISLKTGAILGAGLVAAVAGGLFLYGPGGAKNRKKVKTWAIKAKADVLDEIEKMKDVSEEAYQKAVDKVMIKYGRLKTVGEDEAAKLGKELKRHWKSVKSELINRK